MQVAILVLALTEKDEAMKGGRAALTLKRHRNMSHIKKRKHYMQRPPEAALTGKTAGRQPEKCRASTTQHSHTLKFKKTKLHELQ
jgi:hypothetical protein